MERLTKRDEYGNADIIALSEVMPELYAGLSFSEANALTNALNRLAAYEDAEEQGRLLKLPCKVGDTVYMLAGICGTFYEKDICDGFYVDRDGVLHTKVQSKTGNHATYGIIGRTAFLTQEAAEEALREMEK